MSFLISTFFGAGSINFGMSPSEVRALLGGNFKSFKKTSNAEYPCDYYESLGIFVYYKLPGIVEALEFAEPADPVFNGRSLLKLSFEDLKSMLLDMDKNLEIESDSLISYKLGIGVYAPDADEDASLPVESVIAFEDGYYS